MQLIHIFPLLGSFPLRSIFSLFFIQDNPGHILHQQRQLNEKISSMKWMVDSDDAVAMHSSSQFPACYDKSPINYISYACLSGAILPLFMHFIDILLIHHDDGFE